MNIEDLMAFAKEKGFFWPGAEIYGGFAGTYDYGHLGCLLKRKFEQQWLTYFVESHNEYYLIEASNILPEKTLIASGHAARFNDILIGCSKCHTYFRADVMLSDKGIKVSEGANPAEIDSAVAANKAKCPKCEGAFLPSKAFNMMVDVHLGPEKGEKGYLRPETAQSPYLNFFREFNILRKSLPLGLAVIGRAYRNEISPRQGLYRMRELTQAELQIFFNPENFKPDFDKVKKTTFQVVPYKTKQQITVSAEELAKSYEVPEFYAYHMAIIRLFYRDVIGIPDDKFRFLEKGGDEKAFYNRIHMDIEANVESWGGFKEIGGLHYRGDYDLTCHSKGTSKDLSVKIGGKSIMPHVLELSFGVDRNVWAMIDILYQDDKERQVLRLRPWLGPFSAAVLPLQKDEKIFKAAEGIRSTLSGQFKVFFDEAGSIGRRYARMDEVGTPFCITVDFSSVDETSKDFGTVTVRERDGKGQERVKISELAQLIANKTSYIFDRN